MHPTLISLKAELEQLSVQVKNLPTNDPFNIALNNGSYPGLTRDELLHLSDNLIELINFNGSERLPLHELLLTDYIRRIEFLRLHTVSQIWGGNCAQAVLSYLSTLATLKQALIEALIGPEEPLADLSKTMQKLARQIKKIAADAALDRQTIKNAKDESQKYSIMLKSSANDAQAILAQCDEAYRSDTNENLARAFTERSREATETMWLWVFGLVVALIIGGLLGSLQLSALTNLIKNNSDNHVQSHILIWIELILAILFIGAPFWFACVATKQIGQRFRLAEDYGYKAAISKAYEGYRREAEKFSDTDPEFQARLFASALARLEELPLRLVEKKTYNSPWPHWLSSVFVRKVIKSQSKKADVKKSAKT
jgi:hypothetical protein